MTVALGGLSKAVHAQLDVAPWVRGPCDCARAERGPDDDSGTGRSFRSCPCPAGRGALGPRSAR
eukprot:9118056-Alexandrium_andersonii.AAC.1